MRVKKQRRVRRTAADWAGIFEKFDASGQSATAFCRRSGIGLSSFQRWLGRRGQKRPVAGFVEITPPSASMPSSTLFLEVSLPNGVRLEFRG